MSPPPFLTALLSSYSSEPTQDRPHVTLTFAQSIDGKIGLSSGGQLILSGNESMIMTHWMRTMHDAILVGIGTAINDNPQLNVRHLPAPLPSSPPHHLPRPIILDSHLRLPTTCKLLQNFQAGTGRAPWVICHQATSTPEQAQRKQALEAAGARILDIEAHDGNRLPLSSVLQILRLNEVKSLMVEGGAQVIEAFLSEPTFVDKVVITIAPVLIGPGLGYSGTGRENFQHVHTELFGKDAVVALTAT